MFVECWQDVGKRGKLVIVEAERQAIGSLPGAFKVAGSEDQHVPKISRFL